MTEPSGEIYKKSKLMQWAPQRDAEWLVQGKKKTARANTKQCKTKNDVQGRYALCGTVGRAVGLVVGQGTNAHKFAPCEAAAQAGSSMQRHDFAWVA